jgi:hypothetical protein
MTQWWRAGAVLGFGATITLVGAAPAVAHGVGGVEPTNYRTRVLEISPPTPGLDLRAVDLGKKLELQNGTSEEIVVLGYRGRSRLRAAPGETVRWHDHRAHWMGDRDPPVVRRDSSHQQLVQRWVVELEQGGRSITVRGDVVWVPAPSSSPWLLGALLLAVAVVALSRTRAWRAVLATALGIAVVAEAIHVVGSWQATTASLWSKMGTSVYSFGGIAFGLVALVLLVRRRDAYDATPAALLAGLVLALTGGLADLPSFARSQLASTLPDTLTRLVVMLALGLGAGVAIAAALRLRRPEAGHRPAAHTRRPPARARVTS